MYAIVCILVLLLVARKNASDEGQSSLDSETEKNNENPFEKLVIDLGGGIALNWAKVGQKMTVDCVMIMTKAVAAAKGYSIPDWAMMTGFGKSAKLNPNWGADTIAILGILGQEVDTLVTQRTLVRACAELVGKNTKKIHEVYQQDGVTICEFNTGVRVTIGKVESDGKSRLVFE